MGKRGKGKFPKCKNCGKCCIIGSPKGWVDCPYLIRYLPIHKLPVTRCSIYQHRLYAIVGIDQYCQHRENVKFNFPGCPYNKEEQKTHPKYIS